MSYPTSEDYNQALQMPKYAFADPELKTGIVKTTPFGLPLGFSGGFALTYHITCGSRIYAVRCFHRESSNLETRYAAISRKLKGLYSDYFLNFDFQINGVTANRKTAPIVKMDWAYGKTLGNFIYENYDNRKKISSLHTSIINLSNYLESNGIAHGDIQSGNIMVDETGASIRLIDYDGMYVDEIRNLRSSESGHKNFQHPERSNQWNPKLDRFSFILLDLVLDILEYNPKAWEETKSHEDMFLFSANDFANPVSSLTLNKIKSYTKLSPKIKNFISICKCKFDDIPSLNEFINGNIHLSTISLTSEKTRTSVYINSYPVLDATNFNKCYNFIGEKVELIGQIYGIKRSQTIKREDYVFVNFSDWRGDGVKLNIWSEGISVADKLIRQLKEGNWLSVNGLIDTPYSRSYTDYYTKENKTITHLSITITHPSQISIITYEDADFRLHNYKFENPLQNTLDSINTDDSHRFFDNNYKSQNKNILENIRKKREPCQHSTCQKNTYTKTSNQDVLSKIRTISTNQPYQQSPSYSQPPQQPQIQIITPTPIPTDEEILSRRKYSNNTSSDSNGKERKKWCFITTATCTALGKPDNCDELMAFRTFRDVMKYKYKEFAILVEEYYRIAPLIVEAINNEIDSVDIYQDIWSSHLSRLYKYILDSDNQSVVFGYINMTLSLCETYQVDVPDSVRLAINSLTCKLHQQ